MDYTTDFVGRFEITPPLPQYHLNYLTKFSETRRMKRNPMKLPPDGLHSINGLPHGEEGENEMTDNYIMKKIKRLEEVVKLIGEKEEEINILQSEMDDLADEEESLRVELEDVWDKLNKVFGA